MLVEEMVQKENMTREKATEVKPITKLPMRDPDEPLSPSPQGYLSNKKPLSSYKTCCKL